MARIKAYGSNQTLVQKADGTEVLVSYETPVAAFVPGEGYCRTGQWWSVTTTKHINRYLGSKEFLTIGKVTTKPQAFFDALI